MDTLELKCGKVLQLKPVLRAGVRPILKKLGGWPTPESVERLKALTGRSAEKAADASAQLFSYCAGWGVVDEPTEEERELLEELGFGANGPHLSRINWLRYLLLEDETEAGELIGAVLSCTLQSWIVEEEETEEVAEE